MIRQLQISQAHRRLMRSVRFGRKQIGIEFTTILPELVDGRLDYIEGGEERFSDLVGHGLIQGVHADPGCIEIPSNILTGWRRVIQFYTLVTRQAVANSCIQDSPHSTGGGGHIHISYRQWGEQYYEDTYTLAEQKTRALSRWLADRPWIAWAFNDPSDNTEATVLARGYDHEPAVRFAGTEDNVEFRFFDAAENINEQIEHVAFALRMLSVRAPVLHLPGRVRRMPLTEALDGWKNTIRELGLPWSLYNRYTKNIRERYELGRGYLN